MIPVDCKITKFSLYLLVCYFIASASGAYTGFFKKGLQEGVDTSAHFKEPERIIVK